MLIFALAVLSGCAALVVAQRARAQDEAPVRLDTRMKDRSETSGTYGVDNDPWASGGRGYRNC